MYFIYDLKILNSIYEELGLTATCGIGTNLYLAKIALDITAKHVKTNIAYLDLDGIACYSVRFSTLDISFRIQTGAANTFTPSSAENIYSNIAGVFYINSTDDSYKITGIIDEDIYNITLKKTYDLKQFLDSLKEGTI